MKTLCLVFTIMFTACSKGSDGVEVVAVPPGVFAVGEDQRIRQKRFQNNVLDALAKVGYQFNSIVGEGGKIRNINYAAFDWPNDGSFHLKISSQEIAEDDFIEIVSAVRDSCAGTNIKKIVIEVYDRIEVSETVEGSIVKHEFNWVGLKLNKTAPNTR